MELFLLEHKKLWRKTSTKISVFLCFLYLVVFGSILSFQWFSFGSSDDYTSAFGNNFDGYDMIRKSQEYSLMFGGELTDQSLQKMVGDYQDIGAAGVDRELEKTDMHIINSWLGTLYPELLDTGSYKTMMNYVELEKLTGFYERRQNIIDAVRAACGFQKSVEEMEHMAQTGSVSQALLPQLAEGITRIGYHETAQTDASDALVPSLLKHHVIAIYNRSNLPGIGWCGLDNAVLTADSYGNTLVEMNAVTILNRTDGTAAWYSSSFSAAP